MLPFSLEREGDTGDDFDAKGFIDFTARGVCVTSIIHFKYSIATKYESLPPKSNRKRRCTSGWRCTAVYKYRVDITVYELERCVSCDRCCGLHGSVPS